MKKTFCALVMAGILALGCALGESVDLGGEVRFAVTGGALVFETAPGVETFAPGAALGERSPADLTPMYAWMEQVGPKSTALILRMPHGHALASIAVTSMDASYTPDQLKAMWPSIVKTLSQGALYVADDPLGVTLDTLAGRKWLHIQTLAVLSGSKLISVALEGYASCDAGQMVEIWTIQPTPATYLYDETAGPELIRDQASLTQWLKSITWKE